MGDTKEKAIEKSREVVAALAERVAHQSMVALDHTDDQVKDGMAQNSADAPMWAHLLSKLSTSMVKAKLAEPANVDNSLHINVIGKAENTEEWLKAARPFRRQIIELKEEDTIPDPAVPIMVEVKK